MSESGRSRPKDPGHPTPEEYFDGAVPDSFVGFATVDDFDEDDDCELCAMEREAVRNGALVEMYEINFDEDDCEPEMLH